MKNWRSLSAAAIATIMVLLWMVSMSPASYELQRYSDTVQDIQGNAISGASVYVYNKGTTTLATLYSTGTPPWTAKANPTSTDAYGRFWFYVENGRYNLSIARAGIVTYTVPDILVFAPAEITDEGYPIDTTSPVIYDITGSAACSGGYTGLIVSATTNELAQFNLSYRKNSGAWTSAVATTSTDPFRYPSMYHTITTTSACVLSDVWQLRVGALDSSQNYTAWLDTLTLQLPQELPVIAASITMGPITVNGGDLVAHVTGTVTGGTAYRKRLFRRHDSSFAAMSSVYWAAAGGAASSFTDSFVSSWAQPVAAADSAFDVTWVTGSGPIASYRLEYRYPPSTTWSVLDSTLAYNSSDEYSWNNYSPVRPLRGPVDMRICAVDAAGELSAYAYLDSIYYNQSALIEAMYSFMADTSATTYPVTVYDSEVFKATNPVAGDTLAPQLTNFRIVSVDSIGTPKTVRARVTAGCDSLGAVVSMFHKWGYDGTWADTVLTTVSTVAGLDRYDSTGTATSSMPDTLWIGAFATKNDSIGDVVRDDIYVTRAVPAGETDFDYIFATSGGTSIPYGSPGRTIKPVYLTDSDPAEYWWVRGGADSTLTSTVASTTGATAFRSYSDSLSLLGANRGLVVCYHWPNMATELATATDIDTFRVHVYANASDQYLDYALASGDTVAIALVTDVHMQEPVDLVSDNTTGQYVDNRPSSQFFWAISPLHPQGHDRIEDWAPGSWQGFGVADSVGGLHTEFLVPAAKVEAAIATGTWDGTFAFWIASRQSVAPRYFNMYGPACPNASYRPSIIVKGKK